MQRLPKQRGNNYRSINFECYKLLLWQRKKKSDPLYKSCTDGVIIGSPNVDALRTVGNVRVHASVTTAIIKQQSFQYQRRMMKQKVENEKG